MQHIGRSVEAIYRSYLVDRCRTSTRGTAQHTRYDTWYELYSILVGAQALESRLVGGGTNVLAAWETALR